jgi:hypothetical protein
MLRRQPWYRAGWPKRPNCSESTTIRQSYRLRSRPYIYSSIVLRFTALGRIELEARNGRGHQRTRALDYLLRPATHTVPWNAGKDIVTQGASPELPVHCRRATARNRCAAWTERWKRSELKCLPAMRRRSIAETGGRECGPVALSSYKPSLLSLPSSHIGVCSFSR